MQRQSRYFLLLAVILLTTLISCEPIQNQGKVATQQSTSDSTSAIQNPFAEAELPFVSYTLDAEEGGEIHFETGTKIHIPSHSLVDASGKEITGEVQIEYREFHDAADIILSGIPMTYDTAGIQGHFQTAGMMEINASQNGSKVFLKEGNSMDVQLASFTKEEGYNLYYLDQNSGQWTYSDEPTSGQNAAKSNALQDLISRKPTKPIEPKAADEDEVFEFAVDYKQFPELEPFDGIKWEYAGKDMRHHPNNNEWAFTEIWTEVALKEYKNSESVFELKLSNYKEKYSIPVKPVFSKEDLITAKVAFQQSLKIYEGELKKVEAEKVRLENQADLLRSFAVNSFGIYNIDRLLGMPNVLNFAADFKFEGYEPHPSRLPTVFLVTGADRAVIKMTPDIWKKFNFDPSLSNRLIAVLPDDKVAIFGNEDFANLDLDQIERKGNYTFEMRTVNGAVKNAGDLRNLMRI